MDEFAFGEEGEVAEQGEVELGLVVGVLVVDAEGGDDVPAGGVDGVGGVEPDAVRSLRSRHGPCARSGQGVGDDGQAVVLDGDVAEGLASAVAPLRRSG